MGKLSDFECITGLLILGLIFFIIKQYETELTEKSYVTNTYMYILLALVITALVINVVDRRNLIDVYDSKFFWTLFAVSLISLLGIQFTPENNQVLKHIAWVVFVITMGISLYPIHKLNQVTNQTTNVLLTLICVVVGLTCIANYYPLGYFKSWEMPLFACLCGLVIFQLFDAFFSTEISPVRSKIYAWITIVLFTGFIVFDTQKVMLNAADMVAKCANQEQLGCVDYPSESLGLFLDILNMYSGISRS
jgi:FtsH-binding integral membrane protein